VSYPEADPVVWSEGTGYLAGASSVSPSGAYTYRLPIDVPPGRAGVEPTLALTYASGAGDGPLGVGWSLSGLSEIRRCRQTRATEGLPDGIDYDDSDAFCLDGQKLRQVNAASIASGHEGAEYRTERDAFARIVAHGSGDGEGSPAGPERFSVEAKSGLVFDYRTRVEPHRFRGGYPEDKPVDLGAVRGVWVLTEVRDRSGNAALYDYDVREDPDSHGVEYRIAAIRYTARDDGSGSVGGDLRRVDFEYVDRDAADRRFRYESGVRWEDRSLLSTIKLSAPGPMSPDKPVEVGEYRLAYEPSPITERARLVRVDRCDAAGVCLRPKLFGWWGRGKVSTGANDAASSAEPPAPTFRAVAITPWEQSGAFLPDVVIAADVNGDGLDDVLTSAGDHAQDGARHIRLSLARLDGSGAVSFAPAIEINAAGQDFSKTNLAKSRAVDLDGDGRAEILAAIAPEADDQNTDPAYSVPTYQAFRWSDQEQAFQPLGAPLSGNPTTDLVQLADMDGDGRPDLFRERPHVAAHAVDAELGHWFTAKGQGQATFATLVDANVRTIHGAFARAFDVDGDGRGDLLAIDAKTKNTPDDLGGVIEGATTLIGLDDSGQPSHDDAWRLNRFAWLELVDLNGDGLRDVVYPGIGSEEAPGDGGAAGSATTRSAAPALVRWNLGNGWGEPVNVPSDIRLTDSAALSPERGLRAADFDQDGREDLLSFDNDEPPGFERVHLFRWRAGGLRDTPPAIADRGFPIPGTLPLQHQVHPDSDDPTTVQDGWPYCTLGDVNGDGLVDLVQTYVQDDTDPAAFQLRAWVQEPSFVDLLAEVSDEGSPEPAERVFYKRQRDGRERGCAWPQQCIKRGLLVVDRTETAAGGELTAWRERRYSFEDPRADLEGRGFLGFGKVTAFDPQLRAQTVTDYDHATRVDLPTGGSAYPYAGLPKSVVHIAPIFDLPPDGSTSIEIPDGPLLARVASVETKYTRNTPAHPDALWSNKEAGTYVVHPVTTTTTEFETQVAVTDSGVEIAGKPDPNGRRIDTATDYDAFGNPTQLTRITQDGTFEATATTYDNRTGPWLLGLPKHRETLVSDPAHLSAEPRVTDYDVDDKGRLHAVTIEPNDPGLTQSTTYVLNDDGLPEEIDLTASGTTRKRHVAYDPAEGMFPVDTWNDLGHHTRRLYHAAFGRPLVELDPNNVPTLYKYDGFGRVRRVVPSGGTGITLSYASHDCKTAALEKGVCTAATLDDGGERVTYADELGRVWETGEKGYDGALVFRRRGYSAFGLPILKTRPFADTPGPVTRTTFDSLGRLRQVVGPDTATTAYAHTMDATERTDANGHARRLERDKDDRVVRVYDVAATPTAYSYGPFDQVATITDPAHHTTGLGYDKLGRRTVLVDPDTGITTFEYSGFGELRFMRHQVGDDPNALDLVTEYQRDELGRVRVRVDTVDDDPSDNVPPTVETTKYDYDQAPHGLGKLSHTTSPDGVETAHSYDEHGLPSAVTWTIDGEPFALSQDHDPLLGRPTVLHYPAAPGEAFSTGDSYTAAGWWRAVGRPSEPAALPLWQVDARNLDGAITSARWNGPGVTEQRSYSTLTGRIHRIQVGSGATGGSGAGAGPLLDLTYGFDLTGNVTHRRDAAANRTEDFLYDTVDRLTDWTLQFPTGQTGTQARHQHYGYDDLGNVTSIAEDGAPLEVHTPDPLHPHQLASIDFVTGAGLRTYAHDARGRVTGDDGGRTIDYTPYSLPRHIQQPGAEADFAYDAFGTRVQKTSHDEATGTTTTTITLGGVYERRKRQDASGISVLHVFYVLGEEGPVAQVVYDEAAHAETAAYLARDGLGTASAVFDSQGQLLERLYHEPFGRRTDLAGKPLPSFASTAGVALGFTGAREDDDLGLVDLRGRVYDPVQKRFLTPDPVVSSPFQSQAYNRFAYVWNNPLSYTDPSGFDPEPAGDGSAGLDVRPGDLVMPPVTIRATAPGPAPAPPPSAPPLSVPSSDGRGPQPPLGATAAPAPPAAEPPTAQAPDSPGPSRPGRFVEPDDAAGLVLRYGDRAADGLADGASYVWGAATLGAGYFWGQALKDGGRLAIDGVVDGDPQKVLQGAVKLGETALEITDAPQRIADALTSDSDGERPAGGAKRGPKTDPNAPHNAKIRAEAEALRAEGNRIERGGGEEKEQLIKTEGGHKTGRRPDILYRTPQGELRGRNVGRTYANGQPVKREVEALEDLNEKGKLPTDFVPYDR
jgi:RHS repeat-associated protein